MVEGCGKALSAQGHIDDAFLHLTVTRATAHQNRYVREGGMRMCASLAEHCPSLLSSPESVSLLAQAVATGLRDAWPQVGSSYSPFSYRFYLSGVELWSMAIAYLWMRGCRPYFPTMLNPFLPPPAAVWLQVVYAASLGVRGLLLHPSCGPESLFPLLLPRLCLNRYFVPEGVQVRHLIHRTRSIPFHL
jgi:hypothetical protein